MRRVALRRLVLENFRSFLGRHVLELPDRGLVIVRGVNHDTRGDSGAGKSTIIIAVAYALGFAPYSAKDMRCWLVDDEMAVEVHLETPDGPAVVRRGESGMELLVAGEKFKGGAAAREKELRRILGGSEAVTQALTYREQDQPGVFLGKKDREKKEFLVEVLNLKSVEDEISTSAKKLTTLESDVTVAFAREQQAGELHRAEAALAAMVPAADTEGVGARLEHVHRELDAAEDAAARAQGELERARRAQRTKVEVVRSEYAAKISRVAMGETIASPDTAARDAALAVKGGCDARLRRAFEFEQVRAADLETRSKGVRFRLDNARVRVAGIPRAQADIVDQKEAIEALRASTCPLCQRQWGDAAARMAAAEQNLAVMEQTLASYIDDRDVVVPQLTAELEALKFEPSEGFRKLQQLAAKLDGEYQREEAALQEAVRTAKLVTDRLAAEARAKIVELERERDSQASKVDAEEVAQLSVAHAEACVRSDELRSTESKLESLLQVVKVQAQRRADADARVEKARLKLEEAKAAKAEAITRRDRRADFLDFLRGFVNYYLADVLAEITAETNKVLSGLANVSHVSLEFATDRVTQENVVRQEVTTVARFNGRERPVRSGCSGGMYTSVELAVDLAVARVVARRSNVDLGWMMLDEAFNGHDVVTKQSCLEILQLCASDKLIIIVDHASEVKEFFSQEIVVEYRAEQSRIA